ncbi:sister chromatid cohesion protein Dcc1 [Hygrophoropsis aurantiaca]|uniref:Sister chromatid cohesion protein Dcc1 n=1 Tax=Hygrophoropsis aurantiaca TaxID=72124 RepID=A0ACB8AK59_9AGAM|nr:sister chromatid cohesion protein Dcc1 [Hygrophoropsis aurantiaca]
MDFRFSSNSSQEAGSFRLLELPPELCKLIESSIDETPSLSIKGHATDDAVLCTSDKTYALRSVVLSNTVIVATPSNNEEGGIDIRDQLHEILELVPSVPRLHRLSGLLRGLEYDEGDEDRHQMSHYSYQQARNEIQASEFEFSQGLKDRRILILDGNLRPIVPAHLSTILELLLNYLISLGLSHQSAPVEELASTLADEHEIPRIVTTQILSWFGVVNENLWSMDVNAVITEIGLGILRHHKHEPILETEFMTKWKKMAGDSFEADVQLSLLSGNCLQNSSSTGEALGGTLIYFPSSGLPIDPAARFMELFLTRQRWKNEEIEPFLSDIAINSKERDKLLLKYARALTSPEGVWYTARVNLNN